MTDKFTHPDDAPEGHEWQTRDGREVRIHATDMAGKMPILVSVLYEDGWYSERRSKGGRFNPDTDLASILGSPKDLIDKPKVRVWYRNIFGNKYCPSLGSAYSTLKDAKGSADITSYIGTLKFTYTGGKLTAVELVEGE